jgi:glycosyltransferase involved in cell wall biosynthesis
MKVSIITVAYNSMATIRDTFDSVLNQTYEDIEYIVVDGASKDRTVDIIREYELIFSGKMRWISEPDEGIYDAMNKGIKMSTGDIVGIINSDDFYHRRETIENVVTAFVSDRTVQVVHGDVRYVHPQNTNRTIRYYSAKKFKPPMFRFGFMPHHLTFFTYKHNYERLGYYRTYYKITGDFELMLRFLYKNKLKYRYLNFDFLKMRMGGISSPSIDKNLFSNQEIVYACRENGVYTNIPFVYLRYFVKIFEFVFIKP